jgi:hypothetical protein
MLGMDDGGAQAPANPDKHISLTLTTSETPSEYNGETNQKNKLKKHECDLFFFFFFYSSIAFIEEEEKA